MSKGGIMVFTKDTKIREITQHPSFRGFGHLLFPLQLAFHPEETVQDVTDSNHFIWYSNLKTKTSLEVLNNLLERAQKNEQIFFPIYDEDEMVKDPSKRETGLFYPYQCRRRFSLCCCLARQFPTSLGLKPKRLQCLCSDLSPQEGL